MIEEILNRRYTVSELADEAGITPYTLADRLSRGCPLDMALLLPSYMHLECIDEDPDGTLHYTISECTFYGTTEKLLKYILDEEPN